MQLEVKAGSDMENVELRVVELLDHLIADCRYQMDRFTVGSCMFKC